MARPPLVAAAVAVAAAFPWAMAEALALPPLVAMEVATASPA
jgi:hypothetical protein